MDMVTAIASVTSNPAAILGIESGNLSIGATADLCIINPRKKWTLEQENISSMGKNTPFTGRQFKGCVERVFIGGNEVELD